ncbi:hypothetical protein Poli38472_009331 [Pythium oligandrum]|uniref:Ribosomal RNA processing protein 1 n=1 Tax=Pythium oligandrum TaxID=41045 RepID=A0A8K1CLB4_PYTOL|nr:hypothetical protein Poli38472_009331 [Pythium oligandrum]|eukprot:TMW65164.1 hypothetical protein Poli38472_009331 [Pythium oligandrum]
MENVASRFGQRLAHTEKKYRDQALKKLTLYLTKRTEWSDLEWDKLWKALFYCMWMSDKRPIQDELSSNLAGLVHKLPSAELALAFVHSFFRTMHREWHGIDGLRLDKFYALIRKFVRESLVLLGNHAWETEHVERFVSILSTEVMSQLPNGLRLHLSDLYLVELFNAAGATVETNAFLLLLEPFFTLLSSEYDKTVFKRVRELVFLPMLTTYKFGPQPEKKKKKASNDEDEDATDEEEEEEDKVFEHVKLAAVQHRIFGIASADDTAERNRSVLYDLYSSFFAVTKIDSLKAAQETKVKPTSTTVKKRKQPEPETEEDAEPAPEKKKKNKKRKKNKQTEEAAEVEEEAAKEVTPAKKTKEVKTPVKAVEEVEEPTSKKQKKQKTKTEEETPKVAEVAETKKSKKQKKEAEVVETKKEKKAKDEVKEVEVKETKKSKKQKKDEAEAEKAKAATPEKETKKRKAEDAKPVAEKKKTEEKPKAADVIVRSGMKFRRCGGCGGFGKGLVPVGKDFCRHCERTGKQKKKVQVADKKKRKAEAMAATEAASAASKKVTFGKNKALAHELSVKRLKASAKKEAVQKETSSEIKSVLKVKVTKTTTKTTSKSTKRMKAADFF